MDIICEKLAEYCTLFDSEGDPRRTPYPPRALGDSRKACAGGTVKTGGAGSKSDYSTDI